MTVSDRPQCLLLLGPSAAAHVAYHPVGRLLVEVLRDVGIDAVFPPQAVVGRRATIDIIPNVDMVIADVTGSDPDVMLELGFALGLGKTVLPIVNQSQRSVPADLGGLLYLVYDLAQPEPFGQLLRYWLRQSLSEMHSAWSA